MGTAQARRSVSQRPALILALILVTTIAVTSCATPNEPYRTHYTQTCANNTDCEAPPGCGDLIYCQIAPASNDNNKIRALFVEFDDQGYQHNDKYVTTALASIREDSKSTPMMLVVFAHGWKHNASAKDGNVESFMKMLKEMAINDRDACRLLATDLTQPCHRREVVGIYLGWRGQSRTLEPLTTLSFWERKSRAHRVGTDGASEIISALSAIKENANIHSDVHPSLHTRMVVVGHSFGAAVVYSATQHMLMRDAYSADANGRVSGTIADLVILINPAFEAARAHALHLRGNKTLKSGYPEDQRPLFAVFTSETDWETGKLFPIGRGLSTMFMPRVRHGETEGASEVLQREENTTTIGKYEPWLTHNLASAPERFGAMRRASPAALATEKPDEKRQTDMSNAICEWQKFQRGESRVWQFETFTLERRKQAELAGRGQDPYLFVNVAAKMMDGHSDIWGSEFSKFMFNFMAVQNSKPSRPCDMGDTVKKDATY